MRYTEVVGLPRVEKRVEGENFIVERLSTGDVYVQYKNIFEKLDKAFSNWNVGRLFLMTGPPRTGKLYAAEYFAEKWGRGIRIM